MKKNRKIIAMLMAVMMVMSIISMMPGGFALATTTNTISGSLLDETPTPTPTPTPPLQITPTPPPPVLFQDFELGTGFSAGTNATTTLSENNDANPPGANSVNLTTSSSGDPGTAAQCVKITPKYGTSVNALWYDYLVFYIKDTQGSNTHKVTIVDTNNAVWSGWVNVYSVQNQWTRINVPMYTVTGISKGAIKEIRIGEWNAGTYYIDDVFFSIFYYGDLPPANVLPNRSFDDDMYPTQSPRWWQTWSDTGSYDADYAEQGSGSHQGYLHLTHWKSTAYRVKTYQLKTGMQNGTYDLTAWVLSSGGQNAAQIIVKNYGGSDMSVNIPTASTWTQISINNISVTNGQCEVDIWSDANAGNWLCVDDMNLMIQ